MHVTLRRRDGLPSLRAQRVGKLVLALMKKKNDEHFQIVHFSIQSNHLHLVAEAKDRETVSRKMQGFCIAFAKRLNRLLGGRRGSVWEDRYHRRDVETAGDMRNVLRYVFGNAKKHGIIPADAAVFDPYSSAWTFRGWDVAVAVKGGEHWPRPRPRTPMLARWCVLKGPLRLADAPRSSIR